MCVCGCLCSADEAQHFPRSVETFETSLNCLQRDKHNLYNSLHMGGWRGDEGGGEKNEEGEIHGGGGGAEVNPHGCLHIHQEMSGSCYGGDCRAACSVGLK